MNKLRFAILFAQAIIGCFFCLSSNAQTKADIFKKEIPMTWLGVDFSEARYFGDEGTVSATEMKTLFSKINYLIQAEPEKYNLPKLFYKSSVATNLLIVRQRNDSINESKIIVYDQAELNRLDTAKVIDLISHYEMGNVKGLAVVFFMEGMNKTTEQASIWVTFFNADDKKVLLTARITGDAGGVGFRNHWATSALEVMKKIYSKEYKKWQQPVAPAK